jgi:hypothetical protein
METAFSWVNECAAVDGTRSGSGNGLTGRKPVKWPLCPPQVPHEVGPNPTIVSGSQRLVGPVRGSCWFRSCVSVPHERYIRPGHLDYVHFLASLTTGFDCLGLELIWLWMQLWFKLDLPPFFSKKSWVFAKIKMCRFGNLCSCNFPNVSRLR